MIWDTDTQVFLPRIFSIEPIVIWGITVGAVYLWSFIAAMILMVIFICFFKYTRWGLSMQACADDEMAALSLGVSAKFVYALAWAIAFMAAGVGGTLLGNINGLNYSVSSLGLLVLPAVVLGGLNSVPRRHRRRNNHRYFAKSGGWVWRGLYSGGIQRGCAICFHGNLSPIQTVRPLGLGTYRKGLTDELSTLWNLF